MPKVGELIIDITANNSKLRANLAEASSLIRDWSLLVTGLTGGITNAFRQIVDVGIAALKIGITGLIGAFTAVAVSGAEFQDAMVRTFTILQESSENARASFSSLTQTALNLGRETLFSATDAAQGMQILAKAGFNAREVIDSIRPALNLAIVGNLQLGDSAQFVVNALRGFNLQTEQAGRVADVLALGSSQAATNVKEIGSALSFVAPVAAGVGLSLEETIAALGILANAGIRGSKAGTTLRRALTQLVAPTGRAEEILGELGLSFVDSAGNAKPLVTVIQELNDAGVTAAQTMEIFGLRAGPGMIALMRAGSQAIAGLEEKLIDAEGAAERMSQNFRTTVKGRVRDLMASVVDLGLAFSERFNDSLADSIFAVRNFIVDIVNVGNRMGLFKAAVEGVQTVLGPIIGIIAQLSDRFKDFISGLTPRDIREFFNTIRQSLEDTIQFLTSSNVKETLSIVFETIGKAIMGFVQSMRFFIRMWEALPDSIQPAVGAVAILSAGFVKLMGGILPIITNLIAVKALLVSMGVQTSLLASLGLAVKAAWSAVLIAIKAVVGFLLRALLPVIAVIAVALGSLTIGRIIGEMETWRGILNVIARFWDVIISKVQTVAAGVRDVFERSDQSRQIFVQARQREVLAERGLQEARRDLRQRAARDVAAQEDFGREGIVAGIRREVTGTLQDLGNLIDSEILSNIGQEVTAPAREQVETTRGRAVLTDEEGNEITVQGDRVVSTIGELRGTQAELGGKVIQIMGNMSSGLSQMNQELLRQAEQIKIIDNKVVAVLRQTIKPARDENTRSSVGASLE